MAKKQQPSCTFCGRPADMAEFLIPTSDEKAYICPDCVEQLHSMIKDYHESINKGSKPQVHETDINL